jgi:hypothetical protein
MLWKYIAIGLCLAGTYILGYTSGLGTGRREAVSHGEELRKEAARIARKTLLDAEHEARELKIDAASAARPPATFEPPVLPESYTPAPQRELPSERSSYGYSGSATYIQNINYNIRPIVRQTAEPHTPKNDQRRAEQLPRAAVRAIGSR